MNDGEQRTFVRHAALDALRHQLFGGSDRILFRELLEVTVRAALLHCGEATHSAIALVGAPLVKLDLSRRLVRAGKKAPQHYAMRARGEGLRDVA